MNQSIRQLIYLSVAHRVRMTNDRGDKWSESIFLGTRQVRDKQI